jgi:hypothetical protein
VTGPKPNPLEQVESDNDGMSEAEVEARHADIQRDMRNGHGAKHFERELDTLLATSPSSADGGGMTTAEQEKIEREEAYLLAELAKHVSVQLREEQMFCHKAQKDGFGEGYRIGVTEKGTGRVWEFDLSYDAALMSAGQDEHAGFQRLVRTVVEMAVNERRAFFARVDANVALIGGSN